MTNRISPGILSLESQTDLLRHITKANFLSCVLKLRTPTIKTDAKLTSLKERKKNAIRNNLVLRQFRMRINAKFCSSIAAK